MVAAAEAQYLELPASCVAPALRSSVVLDQGSVQVVGLVAAHSLRLEHVLEAALEVHGTLISTRTDLEVDPEAPGTSL